MYLQVYPAMYENKFEKKVLWEYVMRFVCVHARVVCVCSPARVGADTDLMFFANLVFVCTHLHEYSQIQASVSHHDWFDVLS